MSSSAEETPVQGADKRRRTIFLIDDDPLLVEVLGELLREEGYELEAFTDAPAALARLRTGVRPDVVLLDYIMPVMNGEQFLQELAASGIQLRVLLFTAMSEWRVSSQTNGVCAVLRKPIELDELLQTLSNG
jgi:CheY-like chemotaxis protein